MIIWKNIILLATAILLFLLPIIYIVVWRKKTSAHWSSLIFGALGFIISARVLELIVHSFCIIADNPVSRAINGSTLLYVLYGIIMAGVFEEVGRWVILHLLKRKISNREEAVMYGIGHGGIEVWIVILPVILVYLAVAITGGKGMPAETISVLMPTIEAFGLSTGLCFVLERIFCMGIHTALTVMVFYGVQNHEKKYLVKAIICHMIVDVLPALYQRGVVNFVQTEIWVGVSCVVLCIFAYRLYKKLK